VIVPRVGETFFKYWWNQELEDLKQDSIRSFKLWDSAGKPKTGDIHNKMCKAKTSYKYALRKYQNDSKNTFSDKLNDALIKKDMYSFWKYWNSKFGNKKCQSKTINGSTSDMDIANAFKNYFSLACTANDTAMHRVHKVEFEESFKLYSDKWQSEYTFSVED